MEKQSNMYGEIVHSAADVATEWTVTNTPEFTEGRVMVDKTHGMREKTITVTGKDGNDEDKNLLYMDVKIGNKILPTRCNKITLDKLVKGFVSPVFADWDGRIVVAVHQTIGDTTFIVWGPKAKGGKA